jgi:hypothetical protein
MAPPAKPTAKPAAPKLQDRPHVEHGDEIYFRDSRGTPWTGSVICHGEHGCMVKLAGGKQHKVRWEGVLGHRRRTQPSLSIVDQGEDGFVAKNNGSGELRYVHDPLSEDDGEESMAKALPPANPLERLLALRAKVESPLEKALRKNAPGLMLKPVTDKAGHQTKRWVKSAPDAPKERPHAKPEAPAAAGPPPGHHDAKPGDTVHFEAGEFKGSGKIRGVGAKGATVVDGKGRDHKVTWDEVNARTPPKPGPKLVLPGKGEEKPAPAAAEKPAEKAAKGKKPAAGAKPPGGRPPLTGGPPKPFFTPKETEGLPPKAEQPFDTWEELEAHAPAALKEFTSILHGVAQKLGLRTDVHPDQLEGDHLTSEDGFAFVGPIKKKDRAERKLPEYNGHWNKVTDIIRATISVASFEDVHAAVEAMRGAGVTLAQQPKDKFAKPTDAGYRDLMTIVRLPDGMLAELQYHLKEVTAAKNTFHKQYNAMGDLQKKYSEEEPSASWAPEDTAQYHKVVKEQRDGYGAAWKRAGGTT